MAHRNFVKAAALYALTVVAIGCGTSRIQPAPSTGNTIPHFDGFAVVDTSDSAGSDDVLTAVDGAVKDAAGKDAASLDAALTVGKDAAGEKDGGCTIGATRCAKAGKKGREICGASGWKKAPCEATTPMCVNGKCLVCPPGATFCGDKASGDPYSKIVLKCDANGGSAAKVKVCPEGPCIDGSCMTCPPGTRRCKDGKREICAGGGLLWSPDHCPAAKPACFKGKCVPCVAGELACGKDPSGKPAVMKCDANGTKLSLVAACEAGKFCESGACVSCKPGEQKCVDGKLGTCKANGSGMSMAPCPEATPACIGAKCMTCKPGATYCQAGSKTAPEAVMKCDATGNKGTIIKACNGQTKCHAGTCKACAPGKVTCLGQVPLICNVTGDGYSLSPSCAEKGLLCGPKACACPAGANFCGAAPTGLTSGRTIMACDGTGALAKQAKSCPIGQSCSGGKCKACVPGAKSCAGDKVLACKPDGSGFQLKAPCAGKASCVGGACVDVCGLKTGNPTPMGCRFWAVDLDNAMVSKTLDAQNAPFFIGITNNHAKTVKMTVRLGPGPGLPVAKEHTFNLAAKASQMVQLPPAAWKIKPPNQEGTSAAGLAYRVDSDAAVQVWQFNPLKPGIFSSESSMVLPANGLGTSYRVIGRKQSLADLRAYVAVVATEPGTTKLDITPTANVLKGKNLPPFAKGQLTKMTLQQGQVLNIETAGVGDDFTGSLIESDKPVAVFSGSEAAHAPNTDICVSKQAAKPQNSGKFCAGTEKTCGVDGDCPQTCCADHIEEQLPPMSRWGKVYIGPRFQPRGKEPDTFRILAAESGTLVVVDPPTVPARTLKAGEWFEFSSVKGVAIEATKPVAVGHFMASKGLTGNNQGDPAFVMLSPVRELPRSVRFGVPPGYTHNYIVLASPGGEQVKVDGVVKASTAKIGASGWAMRRVKLAPGNHAVESSGPVTAILHGWTTDASYAHIVGLRTPLK